MLYDFHRPLNMTNIERELNRLNFSDESEVRTQGVQTSEKIRELLEVIRSPNVQIGQLVEIGTYQKALTPQELSTSMENEAKRWSLETTQRLSDDIQLSFATESAKSQSLTTAFTRAGYASERLTQAQIRKYETCTIEKRPLPFHLEAYLLLKWNQAIVSRQKELTAQLIARTTLLANKRKAESELRETLEMIQKDDAPATQLGKQLASKKKLKAKRMEREKFNRSFESKYMDTMAIEEDT